MLKRTAGESEESPIESAGELVVRLHPEHIVVHEVDQDVEKRGCSESEFVGKDSTGIQILFFWSGMVLICSYGIQVE